MPTFKPLTYKDAGVDIDAGNALVDRIRPAIARTRRTGVVSGLGGFGGLFELPTDRYERPLLVAATDGVGTKLRLAIDTNRHERIGIDLVAMCANDVLVQGAEPLFFLDYYATGHLDVATAAAVVEGIATGCELAGAALIGGETAEMPGMYGDDDYDLAGFCVGVVEKDRLIDGSRVGASDVLLGLAASGPHSNGYSLIRKVLERAGDTSAVTLDGRPLMDALLEPTRIYVRPMLTQVADPALHAMAHITGGGLPENLPRVLPAGTRAVVDAGAWPRPAVFDWLKAGGDIPESEMLRTFNCGIGFVAVVAAERAQAMADDLRALGETVWPIGHVEAADDADAPPHVVVTGTPA